MKARILELRETAPTAKIRSRRPDSNILKTNKPEQILTTVGEKPKIFKKAILEAAEELLIPFEGEYKPAMDLQHVLDKNTIAKALDIENSSIAIERRLFEAIINNASKDMVVDLAEVFGDVSVKELLKRTDFDSFVINMLGDICEGGEFFNDGGKTRAMSFARIALSLGDEQLIVKDFLSDMAQLAKDDRVFELSATCAILSKLQNSLETQQMLRRVSQN